MTDEEMYRQLERLAAKWHGREHLEELDMFISRDLVFKLLKFVQERS